MLDFGGNLVTTLTGEAGAGSMLVDGSTLYVVAATAGAIDAFDTTTLAKTRTVASGLVAPGPLVEAGGKLWTSSGTCAQWSTQLASVDPSTGAVQVYSVSSLTYCVGLATSPTDPNLLLGWEPGLEPATITRLDVSTGSPVVVASQFEQDQGNLEQIAVNPAGTTFVTASGSPYQDR